MEYKIDYRLKLANDVFIAKSADVMGDVTIGSGSSIWYGAVARGDLHYIKIGEMTNVQDNAVVHVDDKEYCIIGDYVTVGHGAVVHGCTVGDNCLVGMNATILNRAVIGDNCIIAAGSVVTEDSVIPPNSMVMGTPAKVVRSLTDEEIKAVKWNAERYNDLWKKYHI